MATIPYTLDIDSDTFGNPVHTITWALAAAGADDVGQAYEGAYLADKCVQLLGTLGTFLLQGSNNNVDWFTLTDALGAAINEGSGPRGAQIIENPRYIRPNASGAASGVTVILVGRLSKV